VATKGGTNSFHGSAFETNRNSSIGVARARQDTFTKPPFLNCNEFGGSAGGPVYFPRLYNWKNKTFWFFSWESSRQLQATTLQYSLPTPQMLNGDLSGLTSADGHSITIYDPWSTDTNTWSRVAIPKQPVAGESREPTVQIPHRGHAIADGAERERVRRTELRRDHGTSVESKLDDLFAY
jgi:hypothetical protein